MMAGSALATLYRYELRMLLRDWRTVVFSVLVPVLLMPLLFYASVWSQRAMERRQAETTYRWAASGPESELVRRLVADGEELLAQEDRGDEDQGQREWLTLEEVATGDPAAAFDAGEIEVYVEARSAVTVAAAAESPVAEELAVPRLRLVYRSNQEASATAAGELGRLLDAGRRQQRRGLLAARGFPVGIESVAVLEPRDVATAEQRTGALLGRFATLFVLLLLVTGGSIVAADTLAGEKERGTLETLLTTAISRVELVAAKMSVIATVGVVIAVIQLLNLLFYVGFGVIEVPASFAVDVPPWKLLLLLFLLLPLAALVSSTLLLASGLAKTYKEFQVTFLPVLLLLLLPAAAAVLPGIELASAVVLVPIANLSVAVREVLIGEVDVLMLAIAWGVSAAAAVFAARFTLEALKTERLITAAELDRGELLGGPELFPRRVLRWFAVMWVAIFLAASYLSGDPSLHVQLLINLVVVMLGASLLMIRRYRLDVREALALRPVRPVVWLAVVLGAPSFFLTGVGLARLSGALFPLPERMLEEFSRILVPAETPLWELLLLIAVLPGIIEEITFRGVLLHGLRRRFRPVVLCLVVAVIFGLFHMDLVRLLPTTVIGLALGALTLLTGSLYPAMAWHALNNASAILAERAGLPLAELDPWVYVAATAAAGLAFALLWRYRTPYPGLRGTARKSSHLTDSTYPAN